MITGDTLTRLPDTLSGRGQPVTTLTVSSLRALHVVGKLPSNGGQCRRNMCNGPEAGHGGRSRKSLRKGMGGHKEGRQGGWYKVSKGCLSI